MVYKRKARVLFVGTGDASRASMAAAFANALGAGYLQARAIGETDSPQCLEVMKVMQEVGLDVSQQTLYALSAEQLAWADLLVALDEATAAAPPVLPAGVQWRCYPFAPAPSMEALRQVRDAIQVRVAGMVGGMAMLDRA